MANQKPVTEVRIGRVKAAIWQNETEAARGTTSLSLASTKTAMNGRVRRASGATTCWCLLKWPIRPTRASSSFRRKKSRGPSPRQLPREGVRSLGSC